MRPELRRRNIKKGPARLKMFKRHTENGRRIYGCMTGYTKIDGDKSPVEWPPLRRLAVQRLRRRTQGMGHAIRRGFAAASCRSGSRSSR